MRPQLSVTFRGDDEVQIVIDHDGGYEPDTGAHVIDWHFADPQLGMLKLTEDEEQMIYEACADYGRDDHSDDYEYSDRLDTL